MQSALRRWQAEAATILMNQLQSVVWSEGMFLTPEHFQARDRGVEQNLHFRFSASNFANWGFTDLRINRDKLTNGVFELLAASGLMPDGLAFNMPEGDALPAGRAVQPHFPATQKVLDVWLGIPAAHPNGGNVLLGESEATNHNNCRYRAKTVRVLDENFDPDAAQVPDPKPVPLGERHFKLLFTPPVDATDGFSVLRVGQITRDAAGKYVLNEASVPPCLEFASNTYLVSLLERRVEKLAAKSRNLGQRRHSGNVGTSGFANLQDFLLLLTINSFLPGLQHIRSARFGHPEFPFFQLLNLAGALCSFSSLVDPAELPGYDHGDLGTRFAELDRIIEKLLEPATREKCFSIPLDRQGLFWLASIGEERFFTEGEFFLGVKGNMTVPDLIRGALRTKIGSRDGIDQLHRSAVNGVGLQHETVLPAACAANPGFQYFRLNKTGPFWEDIRTSGSIGIYVQSLVLQAEAELLVSLA